MLRKLLKLGVIVLMLQSILLTIISPQLLAQALNKDELRSLKSDTPWYVGNYADCPSGTSSAFNNVGGDSVWNSGLQPPYILEQFAIETLKNLAKKGGVPESNAVTQEHIIALLAFMFGEGGDIMNNDLFNPLNTGLNAPELLDGPNATNGVQSFKSFDAGVEATARTMAGSNQNRLAAALTDPAVTADQFMHALTYFNEYPGNKLWAEASTADPAGYYQARLQLIQQVRSNYVDMASIQLGTPAFEQRDGIRDASKLQFNGSGGSAGSTTGTAAGSCSCSTTDGLASTSPNTIALDPGHSPTIDENSRDLITGLYNKDYENAQEMANAFTAATKIKALLEAKGYTVVLTKNSADEKINLSERAQRGNDSHAALMFTLHSNLDNGGSGTFYLGYPDQDSVRIPGTTNDPSQRLDGKTGLVHPEVAGPSKTYAEKIAPSIAQKIGQAGYTARSFASIYHENGLLGNGLNYGNTPVQTILTALPEVYSEVSQDILPTDKFAQAAADAISEAQPLQAPGGSAATAAPGNGCKGSGTIVQTALGLVWPDDSHGNVPTDAYVQALAQFNPTVGAGIDCGAFVATVMHASGADPEYPSVGTATQEPYVRSHPEKYTIIESVASTADLLPGDILIVNKGSGIGSDGHTYIYVGAQPPNGYTAASASLGGSSPPKAPHLGGSVLVDVRGSYMVARLK